MDVFDQSLCDQRWSMDYFRTNREFFWLKENSLLIYMYIQTVNQKETIHTSAKRTGQMTVSADKENALWYASGLIVEVIQEISHR